MDAARRHFEWARVDRAMLFPCSEVPFPSATCEEADLRPLVRWMKRWVAFHASMAALPPCVVFDIDHTLVDGKGRGIAEMVSFYAWCLERGVACHLVTARAESEANEAETRRQMAEAGVTRFSRLRMMPAPPRPASAVTAAYVSAYKAGARKEVERASTILLNVGDQWTDMGSEAEVSLLGAVTHSLSGVFLSPSHSYPFVKLP